MRYRAICVCGSAARRANPPRLALQAAVLVPSPQQCARRFVAGDGPRRPYGRSPRANAASSDLLNMSAEITVLEQGVRGTFNASEMHCV